MTLLVISSRTRIGLRSAVRAAVEKANEKLMRGYEQVTRGAKIVGV